MEVIARDKTGVFADVKKLEGKEYRTAVAKMILNEPEKIIVVAFGQLITQWDEARKKDPGVADISDKPGVLATLYNIGIARSKPKANPRLGESMMPLNGAKERTFGEWAKEFAESEEMKEISAIIRDWEDKQKSMSAGKPDAGQ